MATAHEGGSTQHPIRIYLWIWLLLFVFSAFSYMVDYMQLQGALRWALILLFMFVKAGLIIAVFMHMKWERLALKLVILVPPLCLLVLIALMAIEGDYTFLTRETSFTREEAPAGHGAVTGDKRPVPVTSDQ
jgi:cytochrome c oxidase subunit IV